MKILLEASNGERKGYAECKGDDLTIDEVRDDLVIPMLLAFGFHPDNVNGIFAA